MPKTPQLDKGSNTLEQTKKDDFEAEMEEYAQKVKITKKDKKEMKRKQELNKEYELERKLCETNMKKVCDKWEKFLAEAKKLEIDEDLKELRQSIDHYTGIKNEIIRLLVEEFDEIADCRWNLAASFIYALDRLLEIGMSRVKKLHAEYIKNVNTGVASSKEKLSAIEEKENKELENLQLTIFQQQEATNNSDTLGKLCQEEAILGLRSEVWMETEKIEREMDETMEWIIVEMQSRMKTFLYFTKPKRMEVESLREKDNSFQLVRDKDFMRCKMLRANVKSLNERLEKIEGRRNEVDKVRHEKHEALKKYVSLQKIMKENQDADRKKLRLLTVLADEAIQNLQRKVGALDRIIRIKEHCGLFESREEEMTAKSNIFRGIATRQGTNLLNRFVQHTRKIQLTSYESKKELVQLKATNLELQEILRGHFQMIKRGSHYD